MSRALKIGRLPDDPRATGSLEMYIFEHIIKITTQPKDRNKIKNTVYFHSNRTVKYVCFSSLVASEMYLVRQTMQEKIGVGVCTHG